MKPIVDVTKKILLFCMAFSLGTLKVAKAQSGWVQEAPAPGIMPVIDLATDNANRVYALTYPNSEIYYTQNNGSSWAKIPGTLPIHNIDDIEVDKASGTLYISCWNMGMYFTTNLGLTWQHVPFFTNPITGFHASIFKTTRKAGSNTVVCAEVQGHFYGTSSVIRYTNNNGASWSALPVNFGVRAFKFVSNGNLFAPANDGIYVSANNGASWASSSNGVAGLEMTCILEKVGSGTLFAGSKFNTNTNDTTGCGVFVSTDGGNT